LAIIGLGYGPIYPTGVAVLTSRFPHAAGVATSQMGILAAAGGALLPWLQGLVIAQRPTSDSALLTYAVAVATIVAWECTRRLAQRPPT
jgi:fucose permease